MNSLKKKLVLVFAIFCAVVLTACGSKEKDSSPAVYNVKISKVTVSDEYDWIIKGTTAAPDGTKIMATGIDKKHPEWSQAASNGDVSWSKVKDGHFSAVIDPMDITDNNYNKIKKYKVAVFAATKIKKSYYNTTFLSKKTISLVKKSIKPAYLSFTAKQKDYYTRVLDTPSESESSSDSTSTSESSSSENKAQEYEDKLNKLNKGTAESAEFNEATNTVTWTGFDDWANWTNDELQKPLDILQSMTLRYEPDYGYQSVKIVVQLPDKTVIAQNSDEDMDLQIVK